MAIWAFSSSTRVSACRLISFSALSACSAPAARLPSSRQADVPGIDLLLRERGLFLLGGELGFELLRAIAQGCRGILLWRQGGDLRLEIGPDGFQSFEVAPQALDLAQLQVDLLLVGADDRVGVAQLAAQLITLGDGALQLRR